MRILVLISCISIYSVILSQAATNSAAKMFLLEYNNYLKNPSEKVFKKLARDYDFYKLQDGYNIGVLALVDEQQLDTEALATIGAKNDTRIKDLYTFRVPVPSFSDFLHVAGIKFVEVADPVSPELERARVSARTDSVNMGLGGIAKSYIGKDVIIAVIDWGFDYTHPNFLDTSLTHLRLSKAWDQNKTVGIPPSGYTFGAEYIGENALLAAGSDTNYVFGYSSHGTHVAGCASGSGAGTAHVGAAPGAELIFISLRRDAPSLIDAFSYVINYAAAVGKPCVFNMSFGSHLGPHDGSSMKNYGIDILHGPGKIFVGSAGNNGRSNQAFHLSRDFNVDDDTLRTVVNFGSNISDMFGQTLSMWGSQNSDFSVKIELADISNAIQFSTPWFNSMNEPTFIDTNVLSPGDTIIIRMQSTASFFTNGKPNIRLEVKNTSNHKVVLNVGSLNSHVHIWNNVRMNNRYTNWGVSLTSNIPGGTAGNNDYGLGEPAGVGKNVITVASYRAKGYTQSGTLLHGDISDFSSYGPTVDERVKPDIASTGQTVWSSVNSFDITENPGIKFDFDGKEYGFHPFSGTSMSGPVVAGIVALMLEANPKLSAVQAKEILKITARLDNFTGNIDPQQGHLQWGWGKANALAAVLASELYANVSNPTIVEDIFNVYPNPASQFIQVEIANNNGSVLDKIEIINLDGAISHSVVPNQTAVQIDISHLSAGTYLVRGIAGEKFGIKKIIIK
jgi:minor extracellular serine protease Vpr